MACYKVTFTFTSISHYTTSTEVSRSSDHQASVLGGEGHRTLQSKIVTIRIARAERDGTRAETTFRLPPKRTSPFKLVGESVQSTAGSRGVRISLSNAG